MIDIDIAKGKRLLCVICGESCMEDHPDEDNPERWPFRTFTLGMGSDCARAAFVVGLCTEHRRLNMDLIEDAAFGVVLWFTIAGKRHPPLPKGWPIPTGVRADD